ncbi:uncharacterized protein LOC127247298 [Andrographis paniculata]|uniref:uncharacterized protein LOC127247298 n=1 Tax=Andrographis paniculata TaxID=175694 RepID=UPI0021E82FBB|nr:uncharacterized protein LOC127247298 [Andrographis paniculata]
MQCQENGCPGKGREGMAAMNRSSYGYSRVDNEDPEEAQHRRAQFLIYKSMQRADQAGRRRRRPSWLRVKISKLRIKIGKRLKRLTSAVFSAKMDLCKHVSCVFRSCKTSLLPARHVRTLPAPSVCS